MPHPRLSDDSFFVPVREGWGWAVHDTTGAFEHAVSKMHHPRHVAYFWRKSTAQHIADQLHFAYHMGLTAAHKEY